MIERKFEEIVQPEQVLRQKGRRVYSPKPPKASEPLMWVRNFQVTYEMLMQIPDIENWSDNLIGTDGKQNKIDESLLTDIHLVTPPQLPLGEAITRKRKADNLDACLAITKPMGSVLYRAGEEGYEGRQEE